MNYGLSFTKRTALLTFTVFLLVIAPFLIWGEGLSLSLLEAQPHRLGLLVLIAIGLLAADSVAPIPATIVIMFLATKAGWIAGLVAGTIGLSLGVLAAAWLGRTAVGRLVPWFFPDAEVLRLREGLQRNLALTLACWRSVPVLAEASVIIAAAAGIPIARIVRITLLPNFIIAAVYSVAAHNSFGTACIAFLAILGCSMLLWWQCRRSVRNERL